MLNDVRILDLSRLLPGPAATWMLAAHGALVSATPLVHSFLEGA